MNIYDLLPTFKVVEVNNAVAIRSGHMIAQSPMAKADYLDGNASYVENGYILYLDVDGKLKSPGNVNAAIRAAQKPILHYTEEMFTTGMTEELRHFAVEFNAEDVAYPRGLVLHVGDTFTTNNYTGTLAGATLATINDDGVFVLGTAVPATTYNGPLFHVEESTLPDGETDAVELTVLAEVISIA